MLTNFFFTVDFRKHILIRMDVCIRKLLLQSLRSSAKNLHIIFRIVSWTSYNNGFHNDSSRRLIFCFLLTCLVKYRFSCLLLLNLVYLIVSYRNCIWSAIHWKMSRTLLDRTIVKMHCHCVRSVIQHSSCYNQVVRRF